MPAKASHTPRRADDADRRPFRWRPAEILGLAKAAGQEFIEDKAPKQAAALAYYTLFALGPLLLIAISLASLLFSAEAARQAITGQMSGLIGAAGGEAMDTLLEGADRDRAGILGTIIGVVVLLFTAAAVFAQLKETLNRVWEVEAKKPDGWKAKVVFAVRKNLLSFAGVIGTGFLLLVSLLLSTLLALAGRYLETLLPASAIVWQALNFAISFAVVTLVFAAMFKFLPDVRIAWRDVLVGALITAALFVVGQFALGYYLGSGIIAERFGAAGAIVMILVWVYYSGMILYFGAEITQAYANQYGSRVRASDDAVPLPDAIAEHEGRPEEEGLADEKTRERARRDDRRGPRAG